MSKELDLSNDRAAEIKADSKLAGLSVNGVGIGYGAEFLRSEEPTLKLRLKAGVLQQLWVYYYMRGDRFTRQETEWRNIPSVD